MVEDILTAIQLMMTWQNVMFVMIGIAVGIFIGALPGLNVVMATAIMLPVTFRMSPIPAISMLLGVYKGGIFGGSISAILINTPGHSSAAATLLDGYPLTLKGQSLKAMKMGLYASVMSDTSSDFVLIFVSAPLAAIAIKFGPPEIFSLVLFSLTIIAAISAGSMLKGILAGTLGLLFATAGIDPVIGLSRFSFGSVDLLKGFGLIPVLVGLFAVSEVLVRMEDIIGGDNAQHKDMANKTSIRREDNKITWPELRRCLKSIFRGFCVGTFIGAVPGIGATLPAFLSYGMAKKTSKHPERFGKGEIEGVAAAEAGNSAVCGASLIPLLSLGIPGDAVAAVLLGAFMIQGMTPGPMMMQQHAHIIYALFVGLMVCNVVNLFIGSIAIRTAKNVFKMPDSALWAIIILLCFIGTFAVDNSLFDVGVMLFFGIIGYVLRKFGFPVASFLIAFILSPMLENALRQGLIMSHGNWAIFFTRPISLGFIIVTAIVVGFIVYRTLKSTSQEYIGM